VKRAILTPEIRAQLRAWPKKDRREIGSAITQLEQSFGQPHLHRGLGIRPLRDGYYEIRLGLRARLVFRNASEGLVCEMVGSHDEVRRFLKGH